jgi:hypothetical protein
VQTALPAVYLAQLSNHQNSWVQTALPAVYLVQLSKHQNSGGS